jgi:hypothetical protein
VKFDEFATTITLEMPELKAMDAQTVKNGRDSSKEDPTPLPLVYLDR